jgi:predicted DNA-binding transcriptional regulator YafY
MRADRLLSLLLLLQTRGRMTARELAERLEVSERTIYRDVSALSLAGVPVYSERGPGGGCALMDGYRTSLTGLTEAEARTLVISGAQKPLADLGLGGAVEAALLKLQAALPAPQRDDAERARQRVYLDPAGWGQPDATPHLSTIQAAVWSDRRLQMGYRKGNGQVAEYLLDPLGLVAKASVWYLVGGVEDELRTFRVSRVRSAELTDEPCRRPEGFDLAAYWAESSARFRATWTQYPVTLRASPALVALLPQLFGESAHGIIERAGRPDADGWVTLTLMFEGYDAALGRVASFGEMAEVLAPDELREGILTLAHELVAFYAPRAGAVPVLGA